MDRLFLATLLMAEITRLKYGKKDGFTLTHPAIEKDARKRFAKQFGGGLTEKSKPELFIGALGKVHEDNGLYELFCGTMKRFSLNPDDFKVEFS